MTSPNNTRSVGVFVMAVAMIVAACGGGTSTPTANTPTSPTAPTAPAGSSVTTWVVTHRFASVTGPDNCWVRQQRERLTGVVFSNLPMTVDRSGGSISLKSPYFNDYLGTLNGSEFSAQQLVPLEGGGTICEGSSFQQQPGVSNLSGHFSTDDQSLTATEVNSYRLASGEPVIYTWDWQATRR